MLDLTDKVALVTGASRGIGRATALQLAAVGCDVIVNYVTSQSAAEQVAEEVIALGHQAAIVKADVSEEEDIQAMIDFVSERFGRLDILVSNAASGGFRPLMQSTSRQFESTMNTNVRPLLQLVQAAQSLLSANNGSGRRSKVVALSSHGSHMALPAYGLIGASKSALESLVRHLALELGPQGINFNVVLAGLVETDATRNLPEADTFFEVVQERMLVGDRKLTPEEVAKAVVYLCSPMSDLIQGQTLIVDGGVGIRG
jgi:enoyl-[acyl-carrier protein] reductase III